MINKIRKQDKYKLAILTSHPIQYYAPLYKRLASHPRIDLMAYYCSDYGITKKFDPGFGVLFKWDTPLLEGYPYKFLKNISPRPGPTWSLGLINPEIIKDLIQIHYDAIIIQGYTLATNLIAYLTAWITRTPVIFRGETHDLSSPPRWIRMIKTPGLKVLFAGTQAFLSIGSASAKFYRSYGIEERKLFLTPYSVDNEYFMEKRKYYQFQRDDIKKELEIEKEKIVVIFSGKLIDRKRPMDLLLAFEKLDNKKRGVLIYIGDGEQKSMLRDYSKQKNIEDVMFLGFKNQSALGRFYSVADILVHPASFETWGLVINEIMCYGVPIITTNMVGSSFDLVRHGENGFVSIPGDVDTLAKHLSLLISNEELRKRMGNKSLEIISAWNYDVCVESILNALLYVTKKKKG